MLFLAFLTSCQTKAQVGNSNSTAILQIQNSNTEKVDASTKKIVEVQPSDLLTAKSSSIDDVNSKIGIVDTKKGEICLTIYNSDLKEGEEVSVVFMGKPQSVQMATVKKKLSSSSSRNPDIDPDNSFYSLEFPKFTGETVYTAFGLISPNKVVINKGIASVDLNDDKKAEYFRKCTSMEGVHFTVWTGKPLVGKRIWHNYYYLGYDVDPSCKEKDFEELEN